MLHALEANGRSGPADTEAVTVDALRPAAPAAPGPAPAAPVAADPPGPVRRRLVALLVDLALVAVPIAAVAASQAQVVVGDPADPLAPDRSWVTVGGTAYRWTAGGLWLTGVAGLLSALIVLALIPANSSGWTPGLRLVRLRVITTAGTRAQLHHHLVRTVVGLVDLLPFVVPGLLGWYLARRSPLHQRLGDRLARTVVVDHRHPERPVDPGRRSRSGPLPRPEPVASRPAARMSTSTAFFCGAPGVLRPSATYFSSSAVSRATTSGCSPARSSSRRCRRPDRRVAPAASVLASSRAGAGCAPAAGAGAEARASSCPRGSRTSR